MTAQQHITINHIQAQLEAERFEASQAARDAQELDAYSVLLAIEVKLAEGRTDEARAMAQAWRASKRSN